VIQFCPNPLVYGDVGTWAAAGATFLAAVTALYIAARRDRNAKAANAVRASAHAGELAAEILGTSLVIGEALSALKDRHLHSAAATDKRVADVLARIETGAVMRAAECAQVFPAPLAQQIGSLLGLLRQLKRISAEGLARPVPSLDGTIAQGAFSLILDVLPRLQSVHVQAWQLAGWAGQSPLPESFERMRKQLVAAVPQPPAP